MIGTDRIVLLMGHIELKLQGAVYKGYKWKNKGNLKVWKIVFMTMHPSKSYNKALSNMYGQLVVRPSAQLSYLLLHPIAQNLRVLPPLSPHKLHLLQFQPRRGSLLIYSKVAFSSKHKFKCSRWRAEVIGSKIARSKYLDVN